MSRILSILAATFAVPLAVQNLASQQPVFQKPVTQPAAQKPTTPVIPSRSALQPVPGPPF